MTATVEVERDMQGDLGVEMEKHEGRSRQDGEVLDG